MDLRRAVAEQEPSFLCHISPPPSMEQNQTMVRLNKNNNDNNKREAGTI